MGGGESYDGITVPEGDPGALEASAGRLVATAGMLDSVAGSLRGVLGGLAWFPHLEAAQDRERPSGGWNLEVLDSELGLWTLEEEGGRVTLAPTVATAVLDELAALPGHVGLGPS